MKLYFNIHVFQDMKKHVTHSKGAFVPNYTTPAMSLSWAKSFTYSTIKTKN